MYIDLKLSSCYKTISSSIFDFVISWYGISVWSLSGFKGYIAVKWYHFLNWPDCYICSKLVFNQSLLSWSTSYLCLFSQPFSVYTCILIIPCVSNTVFSLPSLLVPLVAQSCLSFAFTLLASWFLMLFGFVLCKLLLDFSCFVTCLYFGLKIFGLQLSLQLAFSFQPSYFKCLHFFVSNVIITSITDTLSKISLCQYLSKNQ